jgi:dihydrodipicolinate synthase/N-acetylneuraminate lyase
MLTTLTTEILSKSVLAVPPLCRKADLSLNDAENIKVMRHIEGGGIRTLLYGGNANFYHVRLSEYDTLLSFLEQSAGPDTLLIPSAGPLWGMMMDQAAIIRRHRFPTVMVLPQTGFTTSKGIADGIRRFVDAAGVPALLYIKSDGYMDVADVCQLAESKTISGIKYATVKENTANDPFLRALCDKMDRKLIVSGIGEQPAIIHLRDFGIAGFTSGVVCVAPKLSVAMLKAIRGGDLQKAEKIRVACKPLEDIRNAINPVRVLHEAVRLAGIADTGPLLPLMSNLEEADFPKVREAAKALIQAEREIAA